MAEVTSIDLSRWIDVGAKALTAIAIPIATIVIEGSIRSQTTAIEQQSRTFEQSMKKQEKNIDLVLKFYEVIGSKRFECYDESKGPLLQIFIDANNFYNKDVQIDYGRITASLVKNALADETCKAHRDFQLAKQNPDSEVLVASSVPGEHQNNADIKNVAAAISKSLNSQTGPETEGGDGWLLLGRYKSQHGFTNFDVFADLSGNHDGGLPAGTVIKSKVPTYLRYSTDDTVVRKNPILACFSEGTCAMVKRSVAHLRGHTWALVTVQGSCPSKPSRGQKTAER
jgi:hypothetical protein